MMDTVDNLGFIQNRYVAYDDETLTIDASVKTLTAGKFLTECIAVSIEFMEGPTMLTYSGSTPSASHGREYGHGGLVLLNRELAETVKMTRLGGVNARAHATYLKNK